VLLQNRSIVSVLWKYVSSVMKYAAEFLRQQSIGPPTINPLRQPRPKSSDK